MLFVSPPRLDLGLETAASNVPSAAWNTYLYEFAILSIIAFELWVACGATGVCNDNA